MIRFRVSPGPRSARSGPGDRRRPARPSLVDRVRPIETPEPPCRTRLPRSRRLKQNVKRRLHNRITKKIIRTYTKRTLAAVAAKEFEKAEADFRQTTAQDRQGRRRRVLHPNTAARRKSKLARDYTAALAKAKASA